MKQLFLIFISLSLLTISKAQNADSLKPIEKTKLIFKIGNGMSRMPAIAMRSCTNARVEMSDYSATDYTLQKFTITVLYNNTKTFKTSVNTGPDFTEETKAILDLLKPGDIIVVAGVSVKNSKGEIIYIQDRNFAVY